MKGCGRQNYKVIVNAPYLCVILSCWVWVGPLNMRWLCYVILQKGDYLVWAWADQVIPLKACGFLWIKKSESSVPTVPASGSWEQLLTVSWQRTGISVSELEGSNFCNNHVRLEEDPNSIWKCSLGNILISVWRETDQRAKLNPVWTKDSQNYKLMHGNCFKPVSLW